MRKGKYQVRSKSSNHIGFSGMIVLTIDEVVAIDRNLFEMVYLDNIYCGKSWEIYDNALRFGISLFLDRYSSMFTDKYLKITIIELHIMPVDTSPIIMMYVTYKALLDAFAITDEFITFDKEMGVFIVNKR